MKKELVEKRHAEEDLRKIDRTREIKERVGGEETQNVQDRLPALFLGPRTSLTELSLLDVLYLHTHTHTHTHTHIKFATHKPSLQRGRHVSPEKQRQAERRGHPGALEAQRGSKNGEGQSRCICVESDRDSFKIH